uniref:Uncharacterized protein n=1 Tax=Strigamia maritima TaxID=126957 RepID=T1JHT2_STRMM
MCEASRSFSDHLGVSVIPLFAYLECSERRARLEHGLEHGLERLYEHIQVSFVLVFSYFKINFLF